MNKVKRDEIFGNLKDFLKTKGIELQDGSYTQRIRKGCDLLTETINVSGEALSQAKTVVNRKLDRVRQVIHEKTAPRGSARPSATPQGQTIRGNAPPSAKAKAGRRGAGDAKRSRR